MSALNISPDFTIEDIHKIREHNYSVTKDMAPDKRCDYYNSKGLEVHLRIQRTKAEKNRNSA